MMGKVLGKMYAYKIFHLILVFICLWYIASPMRNSHLFYQAEPIKIEEEPIKKFSKKRILIDPGHGCQDPGKVPNASDTLNESQFNWQLSTRLVKYLNQTGSFEAFLTRKTEGVGRENLYCLSGGEKLQNVAKRGQMAKKKKADVLLSIHADHGNFTGSWIIWSDMKLATPFAAENERLAIAIGANLQKDGFPMLHYHNGYVRPIAEALGVIYITTHDRYGVHRDNRGLALLKNTEVPAILIETHFISNPSEVERFQNEETYRAFVKSVEHGLSTFFSEQAQ